MLPDSLSTGFMCLNIKLDKKLGQLTTAVVIAYCMKPLKNLKPWQDAGIGFLASDIVNLKDSYPKTKALSYKLRLGKATKPKRNERYCRAKYQYFKQYNCKGDHYDSKKYFYGTMM